MRKAKEIICKAKEKCNERLWKIKRLTKISTETGKAERQNEASQTF